MPIHEDWTLVDNLPEVTAICVDNSWLMDSYRGGGVHKPQARAIALYCEEKFKAHPENMVALLPMGMMQLPTGVIRSSPFVQPTRDLDQIRSALKDLLYGGQPYIPVGQALTFFLSTKLPKRRLLVFSGSRVSMHSDQLKFSAKQLKEFNVAVDVVNFGVQYLPKTKKKLLEAYVAAADNNGNSHYLYAPSGSRTSLGQQILSSPLAPGGLPMQEAMKKELEAKKKELEVLKMQKFIRKIIELLNYPYVTTTCTSPVKEIAAHYMSVLVDYYMMSTSSDKESALLRLKVLYASYMTTNLSSEEKKKKKNEKSDLKLKKRDAAIIRKQKVLEDYFAKELLYASYLTKNPISEEKKKKKKEKAIRRMKKKEDPTNPISEEKEKKKKEKAIRRMKKKEYLLTEIKN